MRVYNKYFQEALDFINSTDLSSLSNGKHVINEGNVWVNVVETNLRLASEALLEAHDEFIDIHIPISASESYGIRTRKECVKPRGEMDKHDDIIFFDDSIAGIISIQPGELAVFAPDMAHAPLIGEGPIRKAIFKVRYE